MNIHRHVSQANPDQGIRSIQPLTLTLFAEGAQTDQNEFHASHARNHTTTVALVSHRV